jgi:D-aminopeptidase
LKFLIDMRISKLLLSMILSLILTSPIASPAQTSRCRDLGIRIGVLKTGQNNAITDVAGVKVGQVTLIEGDNVRTGVTVIIPHDGNPFQEKVPAAIYVANGFGKLMGYTQVEELGELETPVILTNTLSVPVAAEAVIDYTLQMKGNENVKSINPLVGETNDGWLNDIRGRYLRKEHVRKAIEIAAGGAVLEGAVGAGTGTVCFGFKGGIGTSSRRLSADDGGYTIGILVQTNFGGNLQIAGIPIGEELQSNLNYESPSNKTYGSCIMVVATDAPLDSRNLKRLAKRAILGLGRTGGISSSGSGEYVIVFSAAKEVRIPHHSKRKLLSLQVLRNEEMSPLFQAVIEATEEAILNSLFAAVSMTGNQGHRVESLPIPQVIHILQKHNIIK